MKIAIIDMGTNTFHLLLVEVMNEGYRVLERDRIAVKIGEGGITEGIITDEAIKRAIATLKEFNLKIKAHNAERVFATATSAVRSAANGRELVQIIKKETGIDVRIISGDEEAEAIYYGVSKAMDLGMDTSLIVDVGGGSIEFIIGNREQIFWKRSFEMGGQRLLDKFHRSDPLDKEEIGLLKQFINDSLIELIEACQEFKPSVLVGSSGTFDTLSDIYSVRKNIEKQDDWTELPLTIEGFNEIFGELVSKNRAERLKIPGMIEMRVDMIVVASVLVKFIIDELGIQDIRVSSFALKEGILMKTIESLPISKV